MYKNLKINSNINNIIKYLYLYFIVQVPIEKVEDETKLTKYFKDTVQIAKHYNIYKDLFGQGFFRPCLDLNVKYQGETEKEVFYGNRIAAENVIK